MPWRRSKKLCRTRGGSTRQARAGHTSMLFSADDKASAADSRCQNSEDGTNHFDRSGVVIGVVLLRAKRCPSPGLQLTVSLVAKTPVLIMGQLLRSR